MIADNVGGQEGGKGANRYLSHFDAVTLKYRRKKQEGLDGRKRQETAATASNGTDGTLRKGDDRLSAIN
jgi:hypothetical protein